MREAYIVKAYRTAVGKAPRGFFKFKRPDELAAETIEYLISQIPKTTGPKRRYHSFLYYSFILKFFLV